ncbi:MAG: hypothetical protein NVSMB25_21870 [Thermoleophilaceae bacterium]
MKLARTRALTTLTVIGLLGLSLAGPAQARRSSRAPSKAVVQQLLNKTYCSSRGETCTTSFLRTQVLGGRRGHPRIDHVRPGVTVFPARAIFTLTVISGGVTMVHKVDAKIIVFKDPFGDWMYNNVQVVFTPPLA